MTELLADKPLTVGTKLEVLDYFRFTQLTDARSLNECIVEVTEIEDDGLITLRNSESQNEVDFVWDINLRVALDMGAVRLHQIV